MIDSTPEQNSGELDYEAPCILTITIPQGVVCGKSGDMYNGENSEEIPDELGSLG